MSICHRKEIQKLLNPFMVANSHYQFPVDKTKLSCNTLQQCSTTVSLETYLFINLN